MSYLLIPEPALQLLPSLAKEIGLNEAIVLQQIHYWLMNKKVGKWHNDRKWVRNTAEQWQEDNFPFWSVSTIRRTLLNLEKGGYIESAVLNRAGYDRTLWYTINYDKVPISPISPHPSNQSDHMESGNLATPIPETTPETTQKNNSSSHGSDFRAAVIAWENEIHPTLTPIISNDILAAVNEYGSDTVIEAIGIAAKSGKRTWRYIAGILNNWRVSGRNGHSNGTHKNEQPAKQNDDGSYYF